MRRLGFGANIGVAPEPQWRAEQFELFSVVFEFVLPPKICGQPSSLIRMISAIKCVGVEKHVDFSFAPRRVFVVLPDETKFESIR